MPPTSLLITPLPSGSDTLHPPPFRLKYLGPEEYMQNRAKAEARFHSAEQQARERQAQERRK